MGTPEREKSRFFGLKKILSGEFRSGFILGEHLMLFGYSCHRDPFFSHFGGDGVSRSGNIPHARPLICRGTLFKKPPQPE
jgi:hypothetical protein